MESRPQIFACVGPESSGKTTLCNHLAEHFSGIVIPEFARNYLEDRDGKYEKADLIEIAKGQFDLELKYRSLAMDLDPVFCDTDLLVIKVWHEFKYGESNDQINRLLSEQDERKYLLTLPDLEWEVDPLRENPNDLLELFHIYEGELQQMGVDHRVIKGSGDQRLTNAIEAVNQMKLG
jgi:nicotinamide riboside kinase